MSTGLTCDQLCLLALWSATQSWVGALQRSYHPLRACHAELLQGCQQSVCILMVFVHLSALQADVVLVMDQDRLYTQLTEKLKVRTREQYMTLAASFEVKLGWYKRHSK